MNFDGQEWGHFGNEDREGKFPNAFDAYVGTIDDGAKFLELSHTVLAEVTGRANEEQWATGGHILCALYEFVPLEDVDEEAVPGAASAPFASRFSTVTRALIRLGRVV